MSQYAKKAESLDDISDDQLEGELARLQRKYRVMQNDMRAYRDESRKIIAKQDSLIGSLKNERVELETILMKLETNQNKKKDENNVSTISTLSESQNKYGAEINEEKQEIQKLNVKIEEMEEKINSQRKKMGAFDSRDRKIATQKRIRVLENRHDKALVHFNKQLARNRELREEIDHLRQARSVFDGLHKRLQHELEVKKQKISEAIVQATLSYEQRDEAQNKKAALKERSEKDQATHEAEMKDLLRQIDHDKKLKRFMLIKSNERMDLKAEEAGKRRRAADFTTLVMAMTLDLKGNVPNEKRNSFEKIKGIIRSVGKKALDHKLIDMTGGVDFEKMSLKSYEEAFKHIEEVTGESNIEKIVENFILKEEQNFALFNYVNELNNETELLKEQLSSLRDKIEEFRTEDLQFKENREGMMKELEMKVGKAVKEREAAEDLFVRSSKILHQLYESVSTMFKAIGCDGTQLEQMLAAKSYITDETIMIYMGMIEQRTCELLRLWSYEKSKKATLDGAVPQPKSPPKPAVLTDTAKISVMLPDTDDESGWNIMGGDDEDEVKPLSVDDVRKRVEKKIQKQVNNPQLVPPPVSRSVTPSSQPKKEHGKDRKSSPTKR